MSATKKPTDIAGFPNGGCEYLGLDGDAIYMLFPSEKHPNHWFLNTITHSVIEGYDRPIRRDGLDVLLGRLPGTVTWSEHRWNWNASEASFFLKRNAVTSRRVIIYFIETVGAPFVKIGIATNSANARREQLSTGCPFELRILREIPGSVQEERALHLRFDHLRHRGEWFRLTEELRQFIDTL